MATLPPPNLAPLSPETPCGRGRWCPISDFFSPQDLLFFPVSKHLHRIVAQMLAWAANMHGIPPVSRALGDKNRLRRKYFCFLNKGGAPLGGGGRGCTPREIKKRSARRTGA